MGRGVGRWPIEGGQGGRWGRAPESSAPFNGEAWGGGPWRAGKGGDGWGHQRALWEQQKVHCTGLIWLVTRVGGWGRRGEVAHGGRARGGAGGGHQRAVWEPQKVHWFPLLGSLKNLTTGLIWLVTRVGGWGEAWGGGPWRAGKGEDGEGAPESSVGATKCTGLIWLVTRVGGWGEAWGGGPWRAGKGGDGGGHHSLKNLTAGLIWLVTRVGGWGAWGGGPWRAGKGKDGGGDALVPSFGLP